MTMTCEQNDAVRELVNIGVGRASASLNELLECSVTLSVPRVTLVEPAQLHEYLGSEPNEVLAGVQMGFAGTFAGSAELVFPPRSAKQLISLLVGEEGAESSVDERDALWIGTLTEVGNILLNGVLGAISNTLESPLTYDIPSYVEANLHDLVCMGPSAAESALFAQTRFSVEELSVHGDVIILFESQSFREVLERLDGMWCGLD